MRRGKRDKGDKGCGINSNLYSDPLNLRFVVQGSNLRCRRGHDRNIVGYAMEALKKCSKNMNSGNNQRIMGDQEEEEKSGKGRAGKHVKALKDDVEVRTH